jgi:hypothetical protein
MPAAAKRSTQLHTIKVTPRMQRKAADMIASFAAEDAAEAAGEDGVYQHTRYKAVANSVIVGWCDSRTAAERIVRDAQQWPADFPAVADNC